MGSSIGSDECRVKKVIEFAETKFKGSYELLKDAPIKQIRHKLNVQCREAMRYKHLMRTQPKQIWEMIGDSGKSALQVMEQILLEENKAMHEEVEFSVRITRQMELPIELAGSSSLHLSCLIVRTIPRGVGKQR